MRDFILKNILFSGVQAETNLNEKSKAAVLNSISFIGVAILVAFTVIDMLKGLNIMAFATGITASLILTVFFIVKILKKISIGAFFISYLGYALFSFLLYSGGAEKAGYFWMLLFPLIAIFFLGIKHGSITTFVFGVTAYLLIYKIEGLESIPLNKPMADRAIGAYIGVSAFTIAFELIRMIAFRIITETSEKLAFRINQTQMIFENVNQGIFLLNNDLEINKERSVFFDNIFKNEKNTRFFLELIKDKLPERDFVATKDYLELFFNKTVNPVLLDSINPIDKVLMNFSGSRGEQIHIWLEFSFQRIVQENGEIQILGLLKDVTEQVNLEEKLENEKRESTKTMENLFQIIHVNPELMDEFIKDTEDEIDKINELLKVETEETKRTLNNVFTIVHSIKGNAVLLGLKGIGEHLLEFENYIKELLEINPNWQELLKLTVNLAVLKHEINNIKELIQKIISFQMQSEGSIKNKKYILEESLKKTIKNLAEQYNKDIELDLSNYNNDLIPDKYRRLFKDSINQLLRNSVAHGIETIDERAKSNKSPQGKITLSLDKKGDKLEFVFRDDGQGLCIEKIKESAIKKRGFAKDKIELLTGAEAVKLIFHPGFTTTEKVDNVAGQGVGMNVVKQHVDSAGGKLNIKSSKGNYCEFKILLPV